MSRPWTIARIRKLMKDKKIVAYTLSKENNKAKGRKVGKHFAKRSKEKDWIGWNLLCWTMEKCVGLEEEYRFDPQRKWEFDWAIPSIKIAIEYEGLFSEKSRHTTVTGYSGDAQKYNAAIGLGWKVLRFTALDYRQLITELNKHI